MPPRPAMLMIAFAYTFFAYSANRLGDPAHPHAVASARAGFFHKHRAGIMLIACLLTAGALAVAAAIGPAVGLALLAANIFAALYSLRVLPFGTGRGRLRRLRDIPGSKDILIALAWVLVAVGLPCMAEGAAPRIDMCAFAAVAVFALSFSASTALSLGDVRSDRLIGQETMAMLIGRGPARAVAASCAAIVVLAAVIGWAARQLPSAGLGFAFSGAMVFVATVSPRTPGDSLRVWLAVQTALLAAGPVALLAGRYAAR
jgi:4-hydroxy-3-methylbut-2-enyl diphosphate reductase